MGSRYPYPGLLPIERPRCQRCQARMKLQDIRLAHDGIEHRTFECEKCETAKTVTAVADPITSDRFNRLTNSLRPPG
jgi:hypothetical protein